MNWEFKMDHKIIKDYLEDGMCWSNKETTPFVIIEDAHKGSGLMSNLDYVKVNYSVLFWDKNDNIFPYMKNITTTIYNEDLIPYMRDKKLKELLND
jgi:hypothetical protein